MARKAAKLATQAEQVDIELLGDGRSQSRHLLCEIINIEDVHVNGQIQRLFGIEGDRLALMEFVDGTDRRSEDAGVRNRRVATPAAHESNALKEALKIVSKARDESIEIDWFDDPKCHRERNLRLAIIRRVEIENANVLTNYSDPDQRILMNAFYIGMQLLNLPTGNFLLVDKEAIGQDLYGAVARWKQLESVARERYESSERRRLRDQACRDVDQGEIA
jgi:hypothetical protein